MKTMILIALALVFTLPLYAHDLGMPHKVFDRTFAKHIHYLMRYEEVVKLADGEGMPVSETRRHWDGEKNTYLTVDLYQGRVKYAYVTIPDGTTIPIDPDNKN